MLFRLCHNQSMTKRIKRPNDPSQLANLIMRIATGEVVDEATDDGKNASAKKPTVEERSEIAKKAAKARQGK